MKRGQKKLGAYIYWKEIIKRGSMIVSKIVKKGNGCVTQVFPKSFEAVTSQLIGNRSNELMIWRSCENVGLSSKISCSILDTLFSHYLKTLFLCSSFQFLLSTCNILSTDTGSDPIICQCLAKNVENPEYGSFLFLWVYLKNLLILCFQRDPFL